MNEDKRYRIVENRFYSNMHKRFLSYYIIEVNKTFLMFDWWEEIGVEGKHNTIEKTRERVLELKKGVTTPGNRKIYHY